MSAKYIILCCTNWVHLIVLKHVFSMHNILGMSFYMHNSSSFHLVVFSFVALSLIQTFSSVDVLNYLLICTLVLKHSDSNHNIHL